MKRQNERVYNLQIMLGSSDYRSGDEKVMKLHRKFKTSTNVKHKT
jgi:hypothetical protein